MQSLPQLTLQTCIENLLKAYRGPGGTFWAPGQVDDPLCNCEALGTQQSDCLECYRWTSAVVLWCLVCGMMSDTSTDMAFGGAITNISKAFLRDSPFSPRIEEVVPTFYVDDMFWYVIAYVCIYQWSGDRRFVDQALNMHALLLRDGRRCASDGNCDYVWNTNVSCGAKGCRGARESNRDRADDVWGALPTTLLAATAPDRDERKSLLAQAIFLVSSVSDSWDAKNARRAESYTTALVVASAAILANLTGDDSWERMAAKMWTQRSLAFIDAALGVVKATAGGDGQAFRAATYASLFMMQGNAKPGALERVCGSGFSAAQISAASSHWTRTPACGPKGIRPGLMVAPLAWGDTQPAEAADCASSCTQAAAVAATALQLRQQRSLRFSRWASPSE